MRVLGAGSGQGIVPAGAAGLRFSGSWVVVGTGSGSAERGA